MSPIVTNPLRPADVLKTLRSHRRQLTLPIVVAVALAFGYAVLRTPNWEATQGLIVRDEASGGSARVGKFSHVDDMKTTQETILELARSHGVLEAALVAVGPPANRDAIEPWPAPSDVEDLQDAIRLTPPKGAEFGKTEVFYLKVQASNRQRAIQLAAAVCRQLQARFERLRESKAQGSIDELQKTVTLAEADLRSSTRELSQIERRVGSDLAELRILSEHPSGDSDLRRNFTELDKEIRIQQAATRSNRELVRLLEDAEVDPGRLLASPSRLLKSQPALERLKSGLVDAQIRTAQLLGKLNHSHPQVVVSKATEREISQHLHGELKIALKGVQLDLRLTSERLVELQKERDAVRERLDRLAGVRADYANVAATVRNCGEILRKAQEDMAEARASHAAARTASLISLIDVPQTGSRAGGPGRTMIVLAGLLAGTLTSGGLLFLRVTPSAAGRPAATNGFARTSGHNGSGTPMTFREALEKLGNGGPRI